MVDACKWTCCCCVWSGISHQNGFLLYTLKGIMQLCSRRLPTLHLANFLFYVLLDWICSLLISFRGVSRSVVRRSGNTAPHMVSRWNLGSTGDNYLYVSLPSKSCIFGYSWSYPILIRTVQKKTKYLNYDYICRLDQTLFNPNGLAYLSLFFFLIRVNSARFCSNPTQTVTESLLYLTFCNHSRLPSSSNGIPLKNLNYGSNKTTATAMEFPATISSPSTEP